MRNLVSAVIIGGMLSVFASAIPTKPRSVSAINEIQPFANGLPHPNPQQIAALEKQAHGLLPGGALPPKISAEGLIRVYYLATHELLEAFFFTELIFNVTNQVPGFKINNEDELDHLIKGLTVVQGQEEIHSLSANSILANYVNATLRPCDYNFPVSTIGEAIQFSSTLTRLGVSALVEVVETLAGNGDVPFTGIVASVMGEEAEQAGYYRVLQGLFGPEAPFMTPSTATLAYSFLNSLTIPGSCPNASDIAIPIIPPLDLITIPTPASSMLRFSFAESAATSGNQSLSIAYINQQSAPIVEKTTVVSSDNGSIVVEALFPYDAYLMNGLTVAVLVNTTGPFKNAIAVTNDAIAGPALISVL